LKRIRKMKRVEIMAFHPRNFCARERVSCWKIVSRRRKRNQEMCDGFIQMAGAKGQRISRLIVQSFSGLRRRELWDIRGSKEVKMSVNMRGRWWVGQP